MPKFIITWDVGYGEMADVIDAKDQDDADSAAYEAAREEFESQARYIAEPYTKERAINLSIKNE